jgi:CRP-like cAMP-binding protein
MYALKNYILKCVPYTDKEIEEIISYFEYKKVDNKTTLLQEGEVCKFEAFVIKGCLKTYFINKNGFEVILIFATENWWVSDVASFQQETPSRMCIETLEPCELLILTPSKKEKLLQQFPALERMYRLMLQRHVSTYQERLFSEHALTAEERYNKFIERYPELLQRIPQYAIASYLGITPEFLSRLRKPKKR